MYKFNTFEKVEVKTGVVGLKIPFRDEVVQRSVWSDLVIDPFPFFEDLFESWQFPVVSSIDLVKLFRMSALDSQLQMILNKIDRPRPICKKGGYVLKVWLVGFTHLIYY